MSDATEVPPSDVFVDIAPTESFPDEIEWQGVKFSVVKLFQPCKGWLSPGLAVFFRRINMLFRISGNGMAGRTPSRRSGTTYSATFGSPYHHS